MMPTARVTMNGGSLALVMMIPFTKPKAVADGQAGQDGERQRNGGAAVGVHHPLQEDEDRARGGQDRARGQVDAPRR